MLAQLPELDRSTLSRLLTDLRSLGIAPDSGLLADFTASLPVRAAAPVEPRPARPSPGPAAAQVGGPPSAEPLAALHDADPERLAAILCDEPAGLIAHLIGARDFPWRHAVLQQLDLRKRRQVEEHLRRAAHALSAGAPPTSALPVATPALLAQLASGLLKRLERGGHAPASNPLSDSGSRPRLSRLFGMGRRT